MTVDIKKFGEEFKRNHLEEFKSHLGKAWESLDLKIIRAKVFGNVFDIDLEDKYGSKLYLSTHGDRGWSGSLLWEINGKIVNLARLTKNYNTPEEALDALLDLVVPMMEDLADRSVNLCHNILTRGFNS